ncbi:MAG: hypothetical protein GWN84_23985 [Gammaproteobacteria bacterium]|nr:hypothetical protein [Gammaproteobacteria bacterium]NIR85643.1 hypothetical protein [Gammaproteobacteria bacterium]NIR90131.1 hypothetical protein [Gammaproteobacteria bacterium]NIU06777.1 hypothetical protein [Gammaproteobacteria bacterium]NIV53710.1 hypothetical protein [Gammaproteobacteria bacterium]
MDEPRGPSSRPDEQADTATDTVAAAMERVLRAERETEDAIARCREEAEGILEQARAQVRDIARRTDERIGAVQARCADATREHLASLARRAEVLEASPTWHEGDTERLQRAAERLAARLTGDVSEPAG